MSSRSGQQDYGPFEPLKQPGPGLYWILHLAHNKSMALETDELDSEYRTKIPEWP